MERMIPGKGYASIIPGQGGINPNEGFFRQQNLVHYHRIRREAPPRGRGDV